MRIPPVVFDCVIALVFIYGGIAHNHEALMFGAGYTVARWITLEFARHCFEAPRVCDGCRKTWLKGKIQ